MSLQKRNKQCSLARLNLTPPYDMIKFGIEMFTGNKKEREAVVNELKDLKRSLEELKGNEGIETIVQFFSSVSRTQDALAEMKTEKIFSGEKEEAWKGVCTHLGNAGRSEFGWNRTKPGETVTSENVFLGNIYGLFTRPVSDWMGGKEDPKGGWGHPGLEDKNSYDVVNEQARSFMDSHLGPMLGYIETLSS